MKGHHSLESVGPFPNRRLPPSLRALKIRNFFPFHGVRRLGLGFEYLKFELDFVYQKQHKHHPGLVSFTWERLTCGLISIFIQSKRRDDVAPPTAADSASDGVISSSSSSSSNHDQLPDDVITEILSRLPPQHVWEFQYVCKQWVAIISTPSFQEVHYKNQPPMFLFVIQHFHGTSFDSRGATNFFKFLVISEKPIDGYENRCDVLIDITLCRTKPPKQFYKPYLVSSYKGILLFKHDSTEELVLIFQNPVTVEQVTVTAPASRYPYYGFYFHSASEEYRVLYGVLDKQDAAGIGFAILGLRTRSLRRIKNFTHRPSSSAPPIILNGALHWVVSKSHHAHDHQLYGGAHRNPSCSETIMSFGTETEEFHVMPHPGDKCAVAVSGGGGGGESHDLQMRLMEMEEHLCLCVRCDSSSPDRDRLDIWVLEDYKEWIWVKRHVVMLGSLAEFVRHPTINALFIHDGELLLDSKLHHHLFFLYNLKKGSLRRLETDNLEPNKKFGNIVVFQPSLVSLHSRIGHVLSLHDDQVAHWDLEYTCWIIPNSERQHNWSVSKMLLEWKKYLFN